MDERHDPTSGWFTLAVVPGMTPQRRRLNAMWHAASKSSQEQAHDLMCRHSFTGGVPQGVISDEILIRLAESFEAEMLQARLEAQDD